MDGIYKNTQSCFGVPKKSYRPNYENSKQCELQQITFNYSSDIDFKNFVNLQKKCTAKPYHFLVIDATLVLENPSRFRENLLERI